MDKIINVDLLSNPLNWIIVVLMLAIGVYGLALLTAPLDTIGNLIKVF